MNIEEPSPSKTIVVLFEDNASYRNSIAVFLDSVDDILFAGAFPDANDALSKIRKHKPDVVLMDIQMPGKSGIDALREIKEKFPRTKVLIQTIFEDEHKIFSAICAGANGYMLKSHDPELLLQAITDVKNGGGHMSPTIAQKAMQMFQNQFVMKQSTFIELSDREKEILSLMVKGKSYKMIADAVCLSYHTVHWHVKNIYEKLHVNSAPEAVAKAIEAKLV
jgi:DNA-binding NarL/FixJ family response regulator